MYCIVSPFLKTFDDVWLTYFVPDFLRSDIKIGQIIDIPIKTSIENAIVLDIIKEEDITINKDKIKSIVDIVIKEPLLQNYHIKLIQHIAKDYFSSIHNSVNLFLPKNIREKIKKNKLVEKKETVFNYTYLENKELSVWQKKVYDQIVSTQKNKILLYGITWSWKTEIYIKLIKKYLDEWKQVLFLIPEIILTNQIGDNIKKVFWENVLVINSNITEWKKADYWLDIKQNNAKIIVWTRSSIFYPFKNLWLIIMDEEHDNSYISDKVPRYNSIEILEKISELLDIKIVLWSWTPSINTMYKWVKWKYEIFSLLTKFS